ncbi:MAG: DNA recombination protein RmuC, partial [Armatimonadota bacterium]
QETLAQNATAVRDQGARLYDTLCVLSDKYADLGKALGKASTAYNEFGRSLERNTVTAARNLKSLGVSTKKDLSETVVVEFTAHVLTKPELTAVHGLKEQLALPEQEG